MGLDRKKLFGMSKNELLLLKTIQKGLRANQEDFIDLRQYTEDLSIQERRKKRFLAKKKYLKERGISGY